MTRTISILFLCILIFSPLAFGAVELWSLVIMETTSIAALLLLLLRNVRKKDPFLYEMPGIIPLLCLLAYAGLQIIPLPPEFVRIISPETYHLYRETVLAEQAGSPWLSLSIHKKAALMSFFRLSAYIAFYALTIQLLARKDDFIRVVDVIVIFGALLALFGILQHILSNNKIYWIRSLGQGGSIFGPYVNRNHYAGLMEMIFPLVLSLFLYYKPHVKNRSLREKIAELFNLQRTNIYLLLGFASVLIATSIFLTLSRSGIVSLCISMIFFGILFISKGANRKRGIIIVVIFVLIAFSVGWFGWEPIFERFEKVRSPEGDIRELRVEIWKDSMNIIRDFPLFGTGFGSFVNIYPKYRTITGDRVADHAHNDYLEILSDGGFVAFALCLWFVLVLTYKAFRNFLRRREIYSIYLFIAAVSGLLSILMHSITDFNLHIGANGLYFFFLSGVAVSAASTRMRSGLNDSYLKKKKLPLKTLTALVFLVLTVCLVFHAGIITGEAYYSSIRNQKLHEVKTPGELIAIRDTAYRASLADPLEARYPYAAANAEKLLHNSESALQYYKNALRLNPVNSEYLQRTGLVMSELKENDAAERLLRAGIHYDISNPARYKRYALWLFAAGRNDEGIKTVRKSISLEPHKTREYITIMVLNGLSDNDIRNALPERVVPHLLFADYLHKTGNDTMAEEEYLNALQFLNNEEQKKASFFYNVYNFYMKKNRHEDALKIMRQAGQVFPENAGIRITSGDLYRRLGLMYQAEQEYRNALVIEPENQNALKRLDALLREGKK
ncbi:MAG: O-antigen ligase family protein [Nitrospirota bacterium]